MTEELIPQWNKYLAIDEDKIVLAFNKSQLDCKIKEFGFIKPFIARVGITTEPIIPIHEIFDGKLTPDKTLVFHTVIGLWPEHDWKKVKKLGFKHPAFLPESGCFGFINDHLILGNHHHQEIMYRLMSEKGWTWEQLIEAEQVWGWYGASNYGTPYVKFSSDAGIMTSDKIKKKCIKAFSKLYNKKFTENTYGYGGKTKTEYGGNIATKYGTPGKWDDGKTYYTEAISTIKTPLPNPPDPLD